MEKLFSYKDGAIVLTDLGRKILFTKKEKRPFSRLIEYGYFELKEKEDGKPPSFGWYITAKGLAFVCRKYGVSLPVVFE